MKLYEYWQEKGLWNFRIRLTDGTFITNRDRYITRRGVRRVIKRNNGPGLCYVVQLFRSPK